MSVSFVEPNLNKLRQHHASLPPHAANQSDSAITTDSDDDDDDDDNDDASPVGSLPPGAGMDSARGLLTPNNAAKYSINTTTLSNTNSNSLLFRRMSSVSSGSDAHSSERERNLSVASSVSDAPSLGKSPPTIAGDKNSPFRTRISFDTISQMPKAAPTPSSSGFKFGRSAVSTAVKTVDDSFASFSVSSKHVDHCTTYWSRSFLCSMSSVNNSKPALLWLVQNVMENGDELVCLKVNHDSSHEPGFYQREAETMLAEVVKALDTNLKIRVVVEIALGGIKTVVRKTMMLYQPALVVVGTTAKTYNNAMRFMSRKTLSNYLLNHSPVPVIVILPELLEKQPKPGAPAYPPQHRKSSASRKSSSSVEPDSPLTLTSTTDFHKQFNYLSTLINRPNLEQPEDDDADAAAPMFNYKSLFHKDSSSTRAPCNEIDPMAADLCEPRSIPSLNAPIEPAGDEYENLRPMNTNLLPPQSNFWREKRPSWSARLFPKGFRRFSATANSTDGVPSSSTHAQYGAHSQYAAQSRSPLRGPN